jgi:hypothetical protein
VVIAVIADQTVSALVAEDEIVSRAATDDTRATTDAGWLRSPF